jgi:hypothetical protein
MRRIIITLLTLSLVAAACSSGGQVDVEQGLAGEVAAAADTEATPFAERLYGSVWQVIQARQPPTEPVRSDGRFLPSSFGFYGSLAKMQVSVNHECGSATTSVKITNDRIFPSDFAIPPGCESVAEFLLFAEQEIEAAFREQRLELTTGPVSLAARHFISVSDNGTAPLYWVGDPFQYHADWEFADPADATDAALESFEVLASNPLHECTSQGADYSVSVDYRREDIRVAVIVRVDPSAAQRLICLSRQSVVVTLSEPPAGRPIVPWIRPTTVAD